MVEYLDGGRIQGSSTLVSSPPATSWKELGRTTLSSTSDSITVSSLADKDNIMILTNSFASGNITGTLRLNTDTGNNYASRWSENGASDGSQNTNPKMVYEVSTNRTSDRFGYSLINNLSSQEKLCLSHTMTNGSGTGAGNAPDRRDVVSKWANTSNAISSVTLYNTESGDFASGSELVVLGCDNDEADSGTNFWQELASVELSSDTDTFDTGTFTAKKYLKYEIYTTCASGGGATPNLRFNSDTGSNYSFRHSSNYGSDGTSTSNSRIIVGYGDTDERSYISGYIINKSDKEKLVINHASTDSGHTGAGNVVISKESVGKWNNTSSQITSLQIYNSDSSIGDFSTGSYIKVYGAD